MEIINKYVKAFEKAEIPENYLKFSALSIFSACLGRRVYTDIGLGKIYPNLMVYLVGSSETHKSTAIKNSLDILNVVNSETNNIKIAPTDTAGRKQGLLKTFKHNTTVDDDEQEDVKTIDLNKLPDAQEAIDLAMSKLRVSENSKSLLKEYNNSIYISAHELSTFFAMGASELYTLIVELYNNPEVYYYKLSQQDSKIRKPSLSLLGGINPLTLGQLIPKDSFNNNILKHTLLVYEEKTNKQKFPIPIVDKKLLADVAKTMAKATYKEGYIKLDDSAKEEYTSLYNDNTKIKENTTSYLFSQYRTYRPEFVLKIALILASMDDRNFIFGADIRDANTLLLDIEKNMSHAYSEVLVTDKASYRQLVKDFVISRAGVTREEIMKSLKDIPKRELSLVIEGMLEAGTLLIKMDGDTAIIVTPISLDFDVSDFRED